jgi:hypothetical protein
LNSRRLRDCTFQHRVIRFATRSNDNPPVRYHPNMTRLALVAALIIYNFLATTTGVGARCEACPNCDYEEISIAQGNECLDNWTCSGDTITCNYPSAANPGTFNACSYSASAVSNRCCHISARTLIKFGISRVGDSYQVPVISVPGRRGITPNVNLLITLTSLTMPALLHTGTLVKIRTR